MAEENETPYDALDAAERGIANFSEKLLSTF
jgi:hypothetical protein